MMQDNHHMAIPPQNVRFVLLFWLVVWWLINIAFLSFQCFKQVLSDLKQRQAEKLERLFNQNEERLARVERENQVLKWHNFDEKIRDLGFRN